MKITVAQALAWMLPAMGLKYPRDREEGLLNLNRMRSLLYGEFDEFKLFEYHQCIRVCQFKLGCGGDPCDIYYGFTLPSDMCSLSAVWQYKETATLRSKWREVLTGLQASGDGDMETIPIVGDFPTEREVTPGKKLQIFTTSALDAGKEVSITAKMSDGTTQRMVFTLIEGKNAVVDQAVCSIISVITPADQCGLLTLSEVDGQALSYYEPGSQVRSYSRYKLLTHCPSQCILVRGYREYRPVCNDFDIVEIGDQLAIEHAGSYFKYFRSTDTGEQVRAARDKLEMIRRVKAVISRKEGRSKQDGADPSVNRRNRRKGLPGHNTTRRR